MRTNEYVIYESYVLEYVDQRLSNEIKKEIGRVRIKPIFFTYQVLFC